MRKTVTLTSGECEVITRLATKAIAKGDLTRLEGRDARSVREKVVESEIVQIVE